MSSVSRGRAKELLCRKMLEADGWTILYKSVRTRFGPVDWAGLFDVCASKRKFSAIHLSGGIVEVQAQRLNVQVKHQGGQYAVIPLIRKFKEEHGLPGEMFQVWVWHKRKKGVKAHFKVIKI